MSIKINLDKCINCKKCTRICPGNLINLNSENQVEIKDKDRCWGCLACLKECPVEAISYSIGNLEGEGELTLKINKDYNLWKLKKGEKEEFIKTSSKESNKY